MRLNFFQRNENQVEKEIPRKGNINSKSIWFFGRDTKNQEIVFRGENEDLTFLQTFQTSPSVYKAIHRKAMIASTTGYDFIPTREDAKIEEKRELEKFFEIPNLDESFPMIIYNTVAKMCLSRNAAWEMLKDEEGKYQSFYFLYGLVDVVIKDGRVVRYIQRGNPRFFDPSEIIFFKMPSPIDFLGQSQIKALDVPIATEIKALKHQYDNFDLRSFAGDAWELPAGISAEEEKRFLERIKEFYSGTSREPFPIPEGVKLIRGLPEPMEADFLELSKKNQAIVEETLGWSDYIGKNESDFSGIDFFQHEVKPILNIIQYAFNIFCWTYMGFNYALNFKNYSTSIKANARIIQVASKIPAPILTPNDIREMLGLKRDDTKKEMNEYILPFSVAETMKKKEKTDEKEEEQEVLELADERIKYYWRGISVVKKKFSREFAHDMISLKRKIKNRIIEFWKKKEKKELAKEIPEEIQKIVEIPENYFVFTTVDFLKEGFLLGKNNRVMELRIEAEFDVIPEREMKILKQRGLRISKETVEQIQKGDDKTKQGLVDVIVQGLEEGIDMKEMLKRTEDFFTDWEEWRIERKIRTELARVYNEGRIQTNEEMGLKKVHIELGPNPCDWCIANYGKVQDAETARWFFEETHPNCLCVVV